MKIHIQEMAFLIRAQRYYLFLISYVSFLIFYYFFNNIYRTNLDVFFQQRMKKLTTPSKDLKMRGKHAALSPYAANDAKLKADGKIATISEKETHF